MPVDETRMELGRRMMETMRPGMGAKVQGRFNGPSQDFADITIEFLFGEIWQRPALDMRTKEVIVLSALIANRLTYELSVHIPIAINLGFTRAEIIEIVYHLSLYIGLPAAGEAMAVVRDVLGNDSEDDLGVAVADPGSRVDD